MTLRRSVLIAFAAGGLALYAALPATAQSSTDLAARSSEAGGIRVTVKPKSIAAGLAWEFDVTLDTHTKPLDDDLTKATILLDDGKRAYAPAAWQGDAPGGHHRKGVLRFPAPTGDVKSFEIQIEGVGAPGKRSFQWTVH